MAVSTEYSRVTPIKPPAPYIGGKRALARALVARIEKIPHSLYGEVFVGMGGVFFRRAKAARTEIINDYAGDVANLFRILQRHYPQFMEVLRFQLTSRREFERLKATDPATLTDLERAARFLYLQKTSFGGKIAGRTFGVDPSGSARFNLTRLAPVLEDVHERLSGVLVENLPWRRFLERYDREGALFYLDPPYWGCENDYGKDLFGRDEFETMVEVLADLKGRFILSLNDVPEVRQMFGQFEVEEVELTYTVSGGKGRPAKEVIITNRR